MSSIGNDTLYESNKDEDGAYIAIDAIGKGCGTGLPRLLFSCEDPDGIACVYVNITDVRIMHAKIGKWLAKYER